MADSLWEDDNVQFTRLLAEISMMGLYYDDRETLCESMDITQDQLDNILYRAEHAWEMLKRKHLPNYVPDPEYD